MGKTLQFRLNDLKFYYLYQLSLLEYACTVFPIGF
jgi:hypothetical protein